MRLESPKSLFPTATLIVATSVLLCGCTSAPEIEDRFLRSTGTTWRVTGEPLVFQRTQAQYSRSAHDYTYVGPVALNRRGTWDYFLWIGIGSTLDRGFLAPEESAPDSVLMYIDDEPHELELTSWDLRVSALTNVAPYDPPVAVQWNLAARVTRHQIELISNRGIERLILQNETGDPREFHPWGESVDWHSFVELSP